MIPSLAFWGAFGAALFGATAWLGTHLSQSWYGTIEREEDGPLPLVLPAWVFIAVGASVGIVIELHGTTPVELAILALAVLSLTVCAATDVRTGTIPDLFTLGPLILVLAVSAARHEWAPLLGALFAFVPFAAIAVVSSGRGMGWGDVKLVALGGALVGMAGISGAVAVASLSAYIVAVTGGRAREPLAFGPYLAASIGASLALGNSL